MRSDIRQERARNLAHLGLPIFGRRGAKLQTSLLRSEGGGGKISRYNVAILL